MTRRFWLLAYLAFALAVIGLALRSGAMLSLAIPFILYLGAGLLFSPTGLQLSVERKISSEFVIPGAPVEITLTVTNLGVDLESVRIDDNLPQRLELLEGETSLLSSLSHGAALELHYVVRGPRGYYLFNTLKATSIETLGIWLKTSEVPAPGQFAILPEVRRLRQTAIRPWRTHGFSGPIPARQEGAAVNFLGVRQYQLGDRLRWINWRVSARHLEEMFTNEFEQERVADVGIVLDARRRSNDFMSGRSIFEYSIQATASLADAFLTQGNRVGLLIYGFSIERVFPGYGKTQRQHIMRALARARTGHNYAMESLEYLPTRFLPARSQIVLVSPLTPQDLTALMSLTAFGYQLLVVSPDPISYESETLKDTPEVALSKRFASLERITMLHRLEQAGARTVDWPVDKPFEAAVHATLSRPPRPRLIGGMRL
jgi:uncharacterized protein (DUF58 family)